MDPARRGTEELPIPAGVAPPLRSSHIRPLSIQYMIPPEKVTDNVPEPDTYSVVTSNTNINIRT
jgi:hypothetical protein